MSTERCLKHRKDLVAVCNWCGARLCNLCIVHRDGRKVYCDKCSQKLGPLQSAPRVTTTAAPPVQRSGNASSSAQRSGRAPPSVEPYY